MGPEDHAFPGIFEAGDSAGAAAIEWFVRLRDETFGVADTEAFMGWLDEDPAHAAAYAEVEALWGELDAVPPPAAVAEQVRQPERPPRRKLRWAGLAFAASVALVLGLQTPRLWIAAIADARTGTGELRELTLADGTEVVLDAHSAIDVAIDAGSRRIRLLEGRAWFNVAHEARPFTVSLGDAEVRDIGTAFEVVRRGKGGEVAVTEGLVELTAAGGRALQLGAGEAARFDGEGRSRPVAAAPGAATWRQGRLQFVDMRLADLLDDLARYGAGSPALLDGELARRRVTGVVDIGDPVGARDAILARVGARGRRIGPWLFVTAR